jgi:serine/threonine protein phosphatase PrpC
LECLTAMEVIKLKISNLIFVVGKEVALYVKKHFIKEFTKLSSWKSKDYKTALEDCFFKMDELMRTNAGRKELAQLGEAELGESCAGCTATTILITPSEIFCANSGDSRTVLSRSGKCLALSEDHKPDN